MSALVFEVTLEAFEDILTEFEIGLSFESLNCFERSTFGSLKESTENRFLQRRQTEFSRAKVEVLKCCCSLQISRSLRGY